MSGIQNVRIQKKSRAQKSPAKSLDLRLGGSANTVFGPVDPKTARKERSREGGTKFFALLPVVIYMRCTMNKFKLGDRMAVMRLTHSL